MDINLNRKTFLHDFLSPLNKIADKGIFSIKPDCVECLTCSSFDKKEQTIILYTKYIEKFNVDSEIHLNIPNINKLINVFSFLVDENVLLTLDNNSLSYKSVESGLSFRYHLLEEGVLDLPTVKMENIYKMGFDFEADLPNSILKTLLKGSSFADQTNKIYLYTKDNKLHGLLTDENIKNTDNIEFIVANSYTGVNIKKKIPMNLEIFRIVSLLNFENVKIKINVEKGIIMFEVINDKFVLQYIVTSLVK